MDDLQKAGRQQATADGIDQYFQSILAGCVQIQSLLDTVVLTPIQDIDVLEDMKNLDESVWAVVDNIREAVKNV